MRWASRAAAAAFAGLSVFAALASLPLAANSHVFLALVISAPLVVAALEGHASEFLGVAVILLVAAGTGWLTTYESLACTPLANLIIVFPACLAASAVYEFACRRLRRRWHSVA